MPEIMNGYVVHRWRYWNANGFAVAAVATLGKANDWAAYIGASLIPTEPERATVRFVCTYGCKLDPVTAYGLFPEMKGVATYRD